MAHIYLHWESIDDHPMNFDGYPKLLQTYDEEEVKFELDHVLDIISVFLLERGA